MILDKIITLTGADDWNRLRFLAMERSLRDTGSQLPVWVIPYDEGRFDLPQNCHWWDDKKLSGFLAAHGAHNLLRKYQSLTVSNYHFVDTDVIFLKNPEKVLTGCLGFITSCGHWHNPPTTYTEESLLLFKIRTTTWQRNVFNVGQYACDQQLYQTDELLSVVKDERYRSTLLTHFKFSDQVGLNLLVFLKEVPVTNLQLAPPFMESTWAGDYPTARYWEYWRDEGKKPYMVHWAGLKMDVPRPVDDLFYSYLTAAERKIWDALLLQRYAPKKVPRKYGPFQEPVLRLKRAAQMLLKGK
jgi:hypothetical protein